MYEKGRKHTYPNQMLNTTHLRGEGGGYIPLMVRFLILFPFVFPKIFWLKILYHFYIRTFLKCQSQNFQSVPQPNIQYGILDMIIIPIPRFWELKPHDSFGMGIFYKHAENLKIFPTKKKNKVCISPDESTYTSVSEKENGKTEVDDTHFPPFSFNSY